MTEQTTIIKQYYPVSLQVFFFFANYILTNLDVLQPILLILKI